MSGVEIEPKTLEEDITQLQRVRYAKGSRRLEDNSNRFIIMLLPTTDCREGYVGVADQIVQAYAPIGTAEFDDGRGAVVALEAKYRRDGQSRMQELHHQLANSEVTRYIDTILLT